MQNVTLVWYEIHTPKNVDGLNIMSKVLMEYIQSLLIGLHTEPLEDEVDIL